MANWIKQIKDYFLFTKIEQRGIVVLISILVVLILINILLPGLIKPEKVDFSEFQDEIESFEKRIQNIQDSIKNNRLQYNNQVIDVSHLTPFEFDPNNLPIETWKKLGLNNKQIETIKNYEKKGGKFKKKEDLAKIYTLSDEEYQELKPYVVINNNDSKSITDHNPSSQSINPFMFDPNSMTKEIGDSLGLNESTINAIINFCKSGGSFRKKEDFKKIYTLDENVYTILEPFILITIDSTQTDLQKKNITKLSLDINTADTLDLQQLKGIGPSYARRIVKYRDMLGGYYTLSQLLEVYGMDSIRFAGIHKNLLIKDGVINKIDINKATIKEMIRHPYIDFYLAKSIITYREEIGGFNNINQIKNAKLIYEELYQKIAPYLTIADIK